jgi:hypothetical protein
MYATLRSNAPSTQSNADHVVHARAGVDEHRGRALLSTPPESSPSDSAAGSRHCHRFRCAVPRVHPHGHRAPAACPHVHPTVSALREPVRMYTPAVSVLRGPCALLHPGGNRARRRTAPVYTPSVCALRWAVIAYTPTVIALRGTVRVITLGVRRHPRRCQGDSVARTRTHPHLSWPSGRLSARTLPEYMRPRPL